MSTPSTHRTLAFAAEAWRTLIAPILLFLVAVWLLIYDNIIHPPGDPQGTSGVAGVLILISLGLSLDLLKIRVVKSE